MTEQGEAAAKAQSEALARIVEGLEAAQSRSAAVVAGAVAALEGAGREAAKDLTHGLSAALRQGVEESQVTFRNAVEEGQASFRNAVEASGEGFKSAANDLGEALGSAAGQARQAAELFSESGVHAGSASTAMSGVADRAREASAALTDAARGLATAATPVSQSAQAISTAADRVAKAAEAGRDANVEAVRQITSLADGVRQTHEAAATAWRDYRERFEGVDKSLEGVTVKLAETLGDSIAQFRDFAQRIDGELAAAVGKLAGSLDTIETYAASLDEYAEAVRTPALEAAE